MSATEPTVHIVDDDALFLAAVSRLLRASGFAVRTFGSASDFLAQRVEDAPGCVLADLRMPGMNGLELQSALARSANPLPILFLTGHGDIPSSVRAMRDGAEDFLEKRASKAHLLEAVRRALARDTGYLATREARITGRQLATDCEPVVDFVFCTEAAAHDLAHANRSATLIGVALHSYPEIA